MIKKLKKMYSNYKKNKYPPMTSVQDNNISYLSTKTDEVDVILKSVQGKYESVIILGINKGGGLDIRSQNLNTCTMTYITEVFKHKLMNGEFDE